ncbi:hypothetical protein [Anoxybacteroides tepidamans]|uniref:hypothetical protein n=1 Tax=Anoxybacteroides tepidamans TaxID=265948 RepID=UPI000685E652|nr:hypothetical protein [Anoxybacillus tepidamans]
MFQSFYLLKPRVTKSDIFYKVYVMEEAIYFFKIAGQLYNWNAYEKQLPLLLEILCWKWFKKAEKKRALLESEYDYKVKHQQINNLMRKKPNFFIRIEEIKEITIQGEATIHTGFADNGTVVLTLANGERHKFIIPKSVARAAIETALKDMHPQLPVRVSQGMLAGEDDEAIDPAVKRSLRKRIKALLFGGYEPFLDVNEKLTLWGKTLNILWLLLLMVSIIASYFSVYLLRSIPVIILGIVGIAIIFRKEFGKQRYVQFVIAILIMSVFREWTDFPFYLQRDYKVAEGIPSTLEFHSPRRRASYWEVVIDNKEFVIQQNLNEKLAGRWFVIHYLPYSKFVLKYSVLTKNETEKKAQRMQEQH